MSRRHPRRSSDHVCCPAPEPSWQLPELTRTWVAGRIGGLFSANLSPAISGGATGSTYLSVYDTVSTGNSNNTNVLWNSNSGSSGYPTARTLTQMVHYRPEAERKANRLLRRIIGIVAWKAYRRFGYLDVVGQSGQRYRLTPGNAIAAMSRIADTPEFHHLVTDSICFHQQDDLLPATDLMILQLLHVLHDEATLQRVGNWTTVFKQWSEWITQQIRNRGAVQNGPRNEQGVWEAA